MTHFIDEKKVSETTFYPLLIADAKTAGIGLDVVATTLTTKKEITVNNKKYKLEDNK